MAVVYQARGYGGKGLVTYDLTQQSKDTLNAMTLQVGLVGIDGLVVASDKLLQQYEMGARSVGLVSKFLRGPTAICCYAGDILAERAAYKVRDAEWQQELDIEQVRSSLVAIGDAVCQNAETEYTYPLLTQSDCCVAGSTTLVVGGRSPKRSESEAR